MFQVASLQHSGDLRIKVGHKSVATLAPSAAGKCDPILRCELREVCVEQPAQDFPTLLEVPRGRELSPKTLDPQLELQQALRLDDGTDVVKNDTCNGRR